MSTPRGLAVGSKVEPSFAGNQRFEIRRVLGEGGFGVVYEAFDRERGLTVALKTVRVLDAHALYRLKTEFRARADIEHRNLVRLGELLHEDGRWFFTMELVEGWSFVDWIRTTSRTAGDASRAPRTIEERLRESLRQLAAGLDAIHRGGMVHRDLKPSNVLVTSKGRVVILDFGLVGDVAPERRSAVPDMVGTAAYMAPEQARAAAVSPAADMYSVGVMIYEALTGHLPFDGEPLAILMRKQDEDPPPPTTSNNELSRVCMELLNRTPERRPSASAIIARLSARPLVDETPLPFVGRTAELAELATRLDAVAVGGAEIVIVEGESGIGKSSLVRRFLEQVKSERPRTMILSGRCYERESVPFKGIDGVIDALTQELLRRGDVEVDAGLADVVEALARMFPVLRRVPAIARMRVPRPVSPVELRSRAFRGLRSLLASLAARELVILSIDDIQWAQGDTIALLREVLGPPNAPRILLIATRRGDAEQRPELPSTAHVIRLGRLSSAEGHALVALVAPGKEHESRSLVDDADGHPMFLQELARHIAMPRTSSSRFDDVLWARILRIDHRARRVLELVAVAGAPVAQGVVGRALDLGPPSLAKSIDTLRATSLVRTGGTRSHDPVEPYHDRVREAVVAHIPEPRRRRYHERLATVLLAENASGQDPLVVLRHLEAAGATGHAAELAAEAAHRAQETLAFELAAALWDVAFRLTDGDDDKRRDLLIHRAEALSFAGHGTDSAATFLAATAGADTETGFECQRRAAHELLASGHVHEGLALMQSVLAEVGESFPVSTGSATRQLKWRWFRIAVRGTHYREREVLDARTSIDQLRIDIMRSASLGLSMVDPVQGAAFQAKAVLIALKLGDRRRIAYALAFHGMYVAASGTRIQQAGRLMAQAREIAHQCQSDFLLGWTRLGEGITEFFAGHHSEALEILGEAEAQLRDRTTGSYSELNHLRNFTLFALRRMGAYTELRDKLEDYTRDALRRGDRYAATSYVWSSNVVWLAADEPVHAHHELASVSWSNPEEGLHVQHWFHVRAQAELALYSDDVESMPRIETALRSFLGPTFAPVEAITTETRYLLARFAIRRGDSISARRAVQKLNRIKAPYIRAFVRLIHAAADVLDGLPHSAREALGGSIADAEACGMHMPAALARRRLAELVANKAGIEEAELALSKRGVTSPSRFARVFATWHGKA